MARRLAGGISGEPNVSAIQVAPTAVITAQQDQSITLSPSGTGLVVITNNLILNDQNDLRFADADSSNYVAVQAPATIATNYTITWPDAAPTASTLVLAASDTAGTLTWQTPKTFTYSVQTGSFSAVAFGGYFVNTTSGVITATLPAAPVIGDSIRFFDVAKTFDTNTFTVGRNGKLLQGDAANMTVTTEGAAFELVFCNDTFGWRIFSI
jgi:hypothetical protein